MSKETTPVLRIHHAVSSFDAWKRAFDADPVDRKSSGIRRYQIHRAVNDSNFVMIDLTFDTVIQAEAFLQKLRLLWSGPGKAVMRNPEAWIIESVESIQV